MIYIFSGKVQKLWNLRILQTHFEPLKRNNSTFLTSLNYALKTLNLALNDTKQLYQQRAIIKYIKPSSFSKPLTLLLTH